MNRRRIAILGAVGLLTAFVAAAWLYERREARRAEERSASHHAPPFVREGAPTLGNASARVVVLEFFDPG